MASLSWAETSSVTFDDVALGAVPNTFEPLLTGPGQAGEWRVVADEDRGKVVAQIGTDPTDGRFPLLAFRTPAPADVEVRTRIRPVSGKVDQAGGLAVRLLDANNYYLVRANALEGNVRFYKVVAGRRIQLASADLPVKAGQWQDLAIRAEGSRFAVSFAGRELFQARDEAFGRAGRVAFWTKADSVTRFDGLMIRPIDR